MLNEAKYLVPTAPTESLIRLADEQKRNGRQTSTVMGSIKGHRKLTAPLHKGYFEVNLAEPKPKNNEDSSLDGVVVTSRQEHDQFNNNQTSFQNKVGQKQSPFSNVPASAPSASLDNNPRVGGENDVTVIEGGVRRLEPTPEVKKKRKGPLARFFKSVTKGGKKKNDKRTHPPASASSESLDNNPHDRGGNEKTFIEGGERRLEIRSSTSSQHSPDDNSNSKYGYNLSVVALKPPTTGQSPGNNETAKDFKNIRRDYTSVVALQPPATAQQSSQNNTGNDFSAPKKIGFERFLVAKKKGTTGNIAGEDSKKKSKQENSKKGEKGRFFSRK